MVLRQSPNSSPLTPRASPSGEAATEKAVTKASRLRIAAACAKLISHVTLVVNEGGFAPTLYRFLVCPFPLSLRVDGFCWFRARILFCEQVGSVPDIIHPSIEQRTMAVGTLARMACTFHDWQLRAMTQSLQLCVLKTYIFDQNLTRQG